MFSNFTFHVFLSFNVMFHTSFCNSFVNYSVYADNVGVVFIRVSNEKETKISMKSETEKIIFLILICFLPGICFCFIPLLSERNTSYSVDFFLGG